MGDPKTGTLRSTLNSKLQVASSKLPCSSKLPINIETSRDNIAEFPSKEHSFDCNSVVVSGRSRPSAKEGARLSMNVEFCEDNSGTSKKMRYFRKNKVGGRSRHSSNRSAKISLVFEFRIIMWIFLAY